MARSFKINNGKNCNKYKKYLNKKRRSYLNGSQKDVKTDFDFYDCFYNGLHPKIMENKNIEWHDVKKIVQLRNYLIRKYGVRKQ